MKNRGLNAVGAALCGRPLTKGFPNSGAHREAPLHSLSFLRKQESISFFKNHNWIPVFTGMTQSKFKGRLRREPSAERLGGIFFLKNSKGISVLFLVIAMLLMVTIGYVFSYLIPMKQKTVEFPIYSNQAFFIAQSGAEFATRYCGDSGWRRATDGGIYDINRLNGITRTLGNGTLTLTYNNAVGDILTSTGQITGSSENRVVRVSNFSPLLRLTFDSTALMPCFCLTTRRARFYTINVRTTNVTLTAFSASWTAANVRTLTTIHFNGTANANRRYTGAYVNGSGRVNFNLNGNSYTISPTPPGAATSVYITWSGTLGVNSNIIITFYSATDSYTFNLDSAGNGLNAVALCGAGC